MSSCPASPVNYTDICMRNVSEISRQNRPNCVRTVSVRLKCLRSTWSLRRSFVSLHRSSAASARRMWIQRSTLSNWFNHCRTHFPRFFQELHSHFHCHCACLQSRSLSLLQASRPVQLDIHSLIHHRQSLDFSFFTPSPLGFPLFPPRDHPRPFKLCQDTTRPWSFNSSILGFSNLVGHGAW